MSISHCWINTELERAKLIHGARGYTDPVVPVPVDVTSPLPPPDFPFPLNQSYPILYNKF